MVLYSMSSAICKIDMEFLYRLNPNYNFFWLQMKKGLLLLLMLLLMMISSLLAGFPINAQKLSEEYAISDVDGKLKELSNLCDGYKETMPSEKALQYVEAFLEENRIEYENGNYTDAFQALIQALKISEKIGADSLSFKIYNNMANIHILFKDYEGAVKYYGHALELATTTRDTLARFSILVNLINLSSQSKDGEATEAYYNQLKQIPIKDLPNNEVLKIYSRISNGMNLRMKGNLDASRDTLLAVLKDIRKESLSSDLECSVFEELSQTLLQQGNRKDAATILEKLLSSAKKRGDKSKILEAEKALGLVYAELGDTIASDKYSKAWLHRVDSIQNFKEFNRLAALLQNYEIESYSNQIKLLGMKEKVRNAQLKIHRIVIVIGGCLLIVIISFLLILYKKNIRLKESREAIYLINKDLLASEKILRERLNKWEIGSDNRKNEISKEMAPNISMNKESDQNMVELRERIISILEESSEVYKADFSLAKLAKLAQSNTSYVSQLVNEIYGVNFANTVNTIRIKESRRRLANIKDYGNWTIQAIYESVGFRSATTFHSAFKRITGMTPGAFQKMSKEEKG